MRQLGFFGIFVCSLWLAALPAYAQNLQELLSQPSVQVDELVLDRAALSDAYAAVSYKPQWSDHRRAAAVVSLFQAAAEHALDPQDYNLAAITPRLERKTAQDKLWLDLLLTDGLMRYIADIRIGRVSPRQVRGERFSPMVSVDPVAKVQEAFAASDLPAFLAHLAPTSSVYKGLQQVLLQLRAVDAPWPVIDGGAKLRPGATSPRIVQLRARLAATGELGAALADASPVYDPALVEAVKAYQQRAGLKVDGIIGTTTLYMLNVPAPLRLEQVRANMERLRWQPDDLGARHVYVNIPAYQAVAVSNGTVDLNMKVIVGRDERPTPVFHDQIRLIEFNPDWHVPPTIAREDVLEGLRKDPGFALSKKNVRIYQGGQEVDPYTVDWASADIRHYRLRAEPGPRNPLGTVKFLFPNRFDVYLHDTNERQLFAQDVRAISSGCVRVADPAGLTNWLLGADRADWSEERRQRILDSRKQTRLSLATPIPVYLAYITAWLGEDGKPVFRDDIYGQDQQLIAALRAAAGQPRRLAVSMLRAAQNAQQPVTAPAEEVKVSAP